MNETNMLARFRTFIMSVIQFEKEINPLLNRYTMQYATFTNGGFGSLERIELEGFNKLATVDFGLKEG